MVMFEMEHTHEVSIARRLGVKNLAWWSKISYGGGASAATIMQAAAAIVTGLATTVVCHRARNRGARASAPWMQEKALVTDDKALHMPWGLIRPVDVIGMWAHRHMHEYGTTREHFGNVAIAARKHAQQEPLRDDGEEAARHADVPGRPRDRLSAHALRLLPRNRRRARVHRHLGRARPEPATETRPGARRRPGLGSESRAPGKLQQHEGHGDDVGASAPISSGSARSSSRRTCSARRSTTPSRRS